MSHWRSLLIISALVAGCSDRSESVSPIFLNAKAAPVKKAWPVKKRSVFTKRPIVVAVIDTGIADDFKDANFLCAKGHKDFTGKGLVDNHGHGTHISGLIDQYVKDIVLSNESDMLRSLNTSADYCQVILKYYDPTSVKGNAMKNEIDALRYAINIKVDVINFSGGGADYSREESILIKKALSMGIKVVVAAGNESSDISKAPYYPASLDNRLYVVGNLAKGTDRAPSSNYGNKVNVWEYGTDRLSYAAEHSLRKMTGTSQATAIKTGKLVHEMLTSK